MEQETMRTKQHAPVQPRKFLVALGEEVIGTYTTRRIAVAIAEERKATVYRMGGVKPVRLMDDKRLMELDRDRSFEVA